MKREIPPSVNGLPPDGWLFNPKGMPKPLNCSWCDDELVQGEFLLLCPTCDLLERRPA